MQLIQDAIKDQRSIYEEAQFKRVNGYNWFDAPKEFKLPKLSRFKILVKFKDGRRMPFPVWDLHTTKDPNKQQWKEDDSYKRCFQFINEKIYDPYEWVQIWISKEPRPYWKGSELPNGKISTGRHYDTLLYFESEYTYKHCAKIDFVSRGIHTMVNLPEITKIQDPIKIFKDF